MLLQSMSVEHIEGLLCQRRSGCSADACSMEGQGGLEASIPEKDLSDGANESVKNLLAEMPRGELVEILRGIIGRRARGRDRSTATTSGTTLGFAVKRVLIQIK